MSTEFYSKWLVKTKGDLEKVMNYDQELLKLGSIKDRSLANHLIGGLYARYSMVVQELDACLDQMVQVQKGFTVRKLTNAAAARLNELKEELTKLDISEYHYIDGALIELKLIPHDVEIIHPSLVYPRFDEYEQFWKKLKNNETIYEPPEPGTEPEEEGEVKPKKKKKKKVNIDPLALLNAAGDKDSKNSDEEVDEEEENEDDEGESLQVHNSSMFRRIVSRSGSMINKREKKKRPCLRPKIASQLEAEMSTEEKEVLACSTRYLSAVILIQAHERARQSRLYVHDVLQGQPSTAATATARTSIKPNNSVQVDNENEEEGGTDSFTHAAVKIQSWWRRYLAEQHKKNQEKRLRLLIGMVRPSYRPKDENIKFHKNNERRREARYDALREYYKTLIDEKVRVFKVIAPGLFEDIGDEIRQWFKDWFYSVKTFKDIPPVAQGGTVLVIRGDIESPSEHFEEMLKSTNAKTGAAATVAKQKEEAQKAAAEKKAKDEELKKKQAEENKNEKPSKRSKEYTFEPKRTAAMDAIEEGFEEYAKMWANVNDAENPKNKPYMDVITEEKCYEVQMEVRPKVDELMRIELELLKAATQKDKWIEKKGGKAGGKSKKGKKGKKGKKEKKAKGEAGGKKTGKKKKDPTGKRKVEDIFQEMYNNGIIRNYPEVHIDEYMADFSYKNFEQRERYRDPPATLADARQAVIMNCIIPLGVEKMPRPKSVLLMGPRGCGLGLLANAVFNETSCVLFDLSPKNMKGKYAGKKGNKDLTHLVTKMSKLLQPSIIYIEDVEKAFYKKVPKDEKENDPKKVGKFLAKIVKPITQDDRVLVLGTSNYPFLGQAGKLKKIFQKIIMVPRPDYGSIYLFWEEVLLGYHGVDRNFNITALATMTKNYPLPEIKEAIERVLEPQRIIQLHCKPLSHIELIDSLREGLGPITDKEWEKYEKFYAGTKLGKARKQLLSQFTKLVENEKKKEAKTK